MVKLGATLADAQKPFYSISREGDDTYSTHPSRYKRLRAVEEGFKRARNSNLTLNNNYSEKPKVAKTKKPQAYLERYSIDERKKLLMSWR